jgi:hypothetical protein
MSPKPLKAIPANKPRSIPSFTIMLPKFATIQDNYVKVNPPLS